jgi:hypothetical protein
MSFKAIIDGKIVDSERDFTPEQWQHLKDRKDKKDNFKLLCDCPNAYAIPKTVKNPKKHFGTTQYFTHPPNTQTEECHLNQKDNETHRLNQKIMVTACENLGLQNVEMEKTFINEDGEEFRVDVYCENHKPFGVMKLAFELQISRQTTSKYHDRTSKYIDFRLQPVWFYDSRHNINDISEEIEKVPLEKVIRGTHISLSNWQEIIQKVIKDLEFKYMINEYIPENFNQVTIDELKKNNGVFLSINENFKSCLGDMRFSITAIDKTLDDIHHKPLSIELFTNQFDIDVIYFKKTYNKHHVDIMTISILQLASILNFIHSPEGEMIRRLVILNATNKLKNGATQIPIDKIKAYPLPEQI